MKTYLSDKWEEIAACVDRYEERRPTSFTELQRFVEGIAPENQAEALLELAVIDLEFRWKSGTPKRAEDYLIQFPELRQLSGLTDELIRHEYYVRCRQGEEPAIEEYRDRFPDTDVAQIISTHDSSILSLDADDATEDRANAEVNDGPSVAVAPESIGRYLVREEIGSGSFGRVFRCFDPKLNRDVAVKLPHRKSASNADGAEAVLFEARSAARLRDAGIVTVMDADQREDGRVYIVYEYVAGQSLKQRITSSDYSREQAVEWCRQLAFALHYAHKQGIVHRDVKPANVLIDLEGNTRLADFGLARMDDQYSRDDHGKVVGSLAYMSPEQARGDSQWASAQSDVYSLGVILYELLTGRQPFSSGSTKEVLDQIQRRDPVPPRAIDDTIPKEIEQVCLTALAKSARDRYTTARDMGMALQRAVSQRRWFHSGRFALAGMVLMSASILAAVLASRRESTFAITNKPEQRHETGASEFEDLEPDSKNPRLTLWVERLQRRQPLFRIAYPSYEDQFLQDGDSVEIQASLPAEAYVYLFAYLPDGTKERLYPNDIELGIQTKVRQQWLPPDSGSKLRDQMRFDVTADGGYGTEMILLATSDEPLTKSQLAEFERCDSQLNLPSEADSSVQFIPPQEPLKKETMRGFGRKRPPAEELLGKLLYEQLINRFTSYRAVIYEHKPKEERQ